MPNLFRRIFTRRKPVPQVTPEMYVVQVYPGQFCWELDTVTGNLQIITLKRIEGDKYLLLPQPNKMYEVAVNKRNAARKLTERLKVVNGQNMKQ